MGNVITNKNLKKGQVVWDSSFVVAGMLSGNLVNFYFEDCWWDRGGDARGYCFNGFGRMTVAGGEVVKTR